MKSLFKKLNPKNSVLLTLGSIVLLISLITPQALEFDPNTNKTPKMSKSLSDGIK